MPNIKNITILCGGQSLEHEVSLKSASNIYKALCNNYNVSIIKIEKDGSWNLIEAEQAFNAKVNADTKQVVVIPGRDKPIRIGTKLDPHLCDLIFPVLHGNLGEDGTVQSLCELIDLPYIGCNPGACRIAMQKALCNNLLSAHGIPCLPNVCIKRNTNYDIATIIEKISLPIIVKPVHLGSSIGIQVAHTIEELKPAITASLEFDNKVMLEPFITDARELECAVITDNDKIVSAYPGEIIKNTTAVYDYNAKYNCPDSATPVAKADIPEDVANLVMQYAEKCFKIIDGSGLARVDFLYKQQDGKTILYLNEINPMPGYTDISLHPQCMQSSGYNLEQIMQALVTSAIQQYEAQPKK